ncbi:MAG: hypothetical protein KIT48_09355 [Pseudolabrys sp.]|nr:hypothetical protein [Pseudolabrys sp.]
MIEAIKKFFAWVYEWVTVITSFIVGIISVIPDAISSISGVDFAPLIGPERGAQIVVLVAITKAIVAAYRSKNAA